MLNLLIKSLMLIVLAGIIFVTWQFDNAFVETLLTGIFSPRMTVVITLIAASVFVLMRIFAYWFIAKGHRQFALKLNIFLLVSISFIASISLIGGVLDDVNLDRIIKHERRNITSHYSNQINHLRKQMIEDQGGVTAAFDAERSNIKDDYALQFQPINDMLEYEKSRPYKSGPNKGSVYGPGYDKAIEKRKDVEKALEEKLSEVREKERLEQLSIRDYYARKIEKLKAQEADELRNIDVESLSETDQAESKYVVSLKKVIERMTGMSVQSGSIITFLSLLFGTLLEGLTCLLPFIYCALNKNSKAQ